MKAEYRPSFVKDLKRLRGSAAFSRIKAFAFEDAISAVDVRTLPGIKQLKGEPDAYRARIGDHRIGFYVREGGIVFARALHRKEIYRHFP